MPFDQTNKSIVLFLLCRTCASQFVKSFCLSACQTTGHFGVTSPTGTVICTYETFLNHRCTKTSCGFNFDDTWLCGFTYLFILCPSLIGLCFIGLLAPSDVCNTLVKFVYLVAENPPDCTPPFILLLFCTFISTTERTLASLQCGLAVFPP
jgi:hypothetical protein